MEYFNDKTWPYHGMSPHAMKIRSSLLNRFCQDHISDKNGSRGDVPPCVQRPFAAVPKVTFTCAMAVMDKVEGWKRRRMGGIVPRRVHVDLHQGCFVRRTQETHPWTCNLFSQRSQEVQVG